MEQFIHFLPAALDAIGTIMIAWAALKVHHRMLHEHKIDKFVFQSMKLEQRLGITGVFLVAISFIANVLS